MFEDFDFDLLESPDFKEDAVREEIITPLLHRLGYRAHGDFQILRSKALLHPYVMIGSQRRKTNIIPDYLLRVKNHFAFVLDAKSPNQNIITGSNVEQVYSYAIHPEVRAKLYALCNGYELTVFHINQVQPVSRFDLREIENNWADCQKLLSPYTILAYQPKPQNLYPDFGRHLYKMGYVSSGKEFTFYDMPVDQIVHVNDQTLSINNNYAPDGVEFALCLDFNYDKLIELMKFIRRDQQHLIIDGLSRQPYKVDILPPFNISFRANLGVLTETQHEEIRPLVVIEFFDKG